MTARTTYPPEMLRGVDWSAWTSDSRILRTDDMSDGM